MAKRLEEMMMVLCQKENYKTLASFLKINKWKNHLEQVLFRTIYNYFCNLD